MRGTANVSVAKFIDGFDVIAQDSFDTASTTYTIPEDGIYSVYIQAPGGSVTTAGDNRIYTSLKFGNNVAGLVAVNYYPGGHYCNLTVPPLNLKKGVVINLNSSGQLISASKTYQIMKYTQS